METHTNSVRLGWSAYASDVGGHRHCGGKIHAKVADVGRLHTNHCILITV